MVASVDVAGSPVEDLVVRIGHGSGSETFMVLMTRDDGALTALPLNVFVVGGGLAMAQAEARAHYVGYFKGRERGEPIPRAFCLRPYILIMSI